MMPICRIVKAAIRNSFQLLSDDIDEAGTSRYAHFIEANNEAAMKVLTPLPKKKDKLFAVGPNHLSICISYRADGCGIWGLGTYRQKGLCRF